MGKLPSDISGRTVVKVLQSQGFEVSRQKGSHIILHRVDPKSRVTVPDHRVLRGGTLRQIISDAGLSVDEFLKLIG